MYVLKITVYYRGTCKVPFLRKKEPKKGEAVGL